uniref:Uncharacterized protein n=1 Tax=Chlamydomonas euryale TaxID=1486919 RepID=A0A7R9YZ06_9CHLO|mmetsp:Transcript_34747/g.103083  ORF Transcript_34747/g.103083 Transcript_34747/m.103083 type:complete len:117 (+) Transcript_34747:263-613(+)
MLLGPTVATAGLSVQIPMAAVADVLLGNATWTKSAQTFLFTLGGTVLILVGFFYINMVGSKGAMINEAAHVNSSNEEDDNEKFEEASLLSDQPSISRGDEMIVTRSSADKVHRPLK